MVWRLNKKKIFLAIPKTDGRMILVKAKLHGYSTILTISSSSSSLELGSNISTNLPQLKK